MIDRENDDDPRVDRLVLEHLQRSAARVDSQTLVQRILAERLALPVSTSTSGEEPSPRPDASSGAKSDAGSDVKPRAAVSWRRTVSWWGTAALLMALAFLGGRYFDHHAAVAATALQGVQNHHAQSIDYYYRVRFDPDPRTWNPKNRLEGHRSVICGRAGTDSGLTVKSGTSGSSWDAKRMAPSGSPGGLKKESGSATVSKIFLPQLPRSARSIP